MSNTVKNKMGRPSGREAQKVKLQDLLDKFHPSMEIPIPYVFAREFNLLPEDLKAAKLERFLLKSAKKAAKKADKKSAAKKTPAKKTAKKKTAKKKKLSLFGKLFGNKRNTDFD